MSLLRRAKMKSFNEWLLEHTQSEILEEAKNTVKKKKKKKWIQKAIKHPGRCADMGGPDCPAGSPQYKLAKRLKKGGDIYASKKKQSKKKQTD